MHDFKLNLMIKYAKDINCSKYLKIMYINSKQARVKLKIKLYGLGIDYRKYCVATIGSISSDTYTKHSDVDIVIYSNQKINEKDKSIFYQLKSSYDNIYLQFLNQKDYKYYKNKLSFWFLLNEIVPVFGNPKLINNFKDKCFYKLQKFSLSYLNTLYENDLGRNKDYSNSESIHYYNLKRGYGSFLDYNYGKVLFEWIRLNKSFPESIIEGYPFVLDLMGKYLSILKYLNYTIHSASNEYTKYFEQHYFLFSNLENSLLCPCILHNIRNTISYFPNNIMTIIKSKGVAYENRV